MKICNGFFLYGEKGVKSVQRDRVGGIGKALAEAPGGVCQGAGGQLHCLEAGQVLAVLQGDAPALSAPEAVAAVVPGIAQNHHGLFPQGLGLPQGMAHQGAGQSFSLKGGEDGQGTEGDGVQIPACLQLDGAGGAGDLPGPDAVRLAYEGQLRAEGGGLTEQMEIVVLVAAGLVDVPKGLPHQRFRGAAVGGGLVAKGQ